MDDPTTQDKNELRRRITGQGFAFVAGAEFRALLGGGAPDLAAGARAAALDEADWRAFAASWDDLPRDTYLPEGHRYRRRRHATLSARAGDTDFRIEPHRAHYQSRDYNPLVGGIERWFEPMRPRVLAGATFGAVMRFCLGFFGPLRPAADWHIECHQFRIEARREALGQPTPEGVHRDGVDYVLVMLVDRVNIESGTTTIHGLDGRPLGSFTLAAAFDAALVDDARVKHGVTPVRAVDPERPAHRDVLVVTLRDRATIAR